MSARFKFYLILIAVLFTIFYVASSHAFPISKPNTFDNQPILVESSGWEGQGLLVFYYPVTKLVCFMNDSSVVCIPLKGFHQSYKNLVNQKMAEKEITNDRSSR